MSSQSRPSLHFCSCSIQACYTQRETSFIFMYQNKCTWSKHKWRSSACECPLLIFARLQLCSKLWLKDVFHNTDIIFLFTCRKKKSVPAIALATNVILHRFEVYWSVNDHSLELNISCCYKRTMEMQPAWLLISPLAVGT